MCAHTMSIRGDEKRTVKFVKLHIWASAAKWECVPFHWKIEVQISLKIHILKYFLDFLDIS